jgi:anti-sigma28 factor (negative regulator of flagellin synthesis)
MDIKGIGNSNYGSFNEIQKKQDVPNAKPVKAGDKIEISKEAKLLKSNSISEKDFSKIRERINTGFYDKPEVISKIADNILKEITPESN